MITLPDFQIVQPLYESENSSVYRAIRQLDQQPVVLKYLKTDYPSATQLARYQHEYELLTHLTLPGIIQVYGLEHWQDHLILVLEDFGGESLNLWLKQRTFTVTECLSLAIQMADSLGQIHAANVIHKDINPANLVWNPTTGTLKLIDFGIATRLPRETLSLQNPNQLEGTLPYLSPEQTGRMNRALDYRTDLYSLGVTFYELFTGRLPFESQEAMELVHCHLAKQPIPPHQVNTDVPPVISHLILRLMAKAAEERYQSAWGVKADLEQILSNLTGLTDLSGFEQFEPFELGQHDFSDRFHLPQKLYGREEELQQLLAAFENVSSGQSQLLLVAGYSGIGKTAVVQEIYKPITEKRGYFIAGKFDQFQRNIPYSAMVQAFRDLVRQLLTETQAQLDDWKAKILTAVGHNGQVIIDVISEVELILGPQPAVPTLPPTESQNRFNLVFQNFIQVFGQAEHPLVIFLDDLQWVDSASLKLMTLMMSDIPYLLLIGAYRDNEVSPVHPLMTTLEEMHKQELLVQTLTLTPLALSHLNQLVSDTLRLPLPQTLPLAELVLEKTGGNPFFVGEFLKTLYVEQLLSFNSSPREWHWDLAQIKARNITDNVVELMTGKIRRLKPLLQQVLTLAAAMGNQFDLATLSIVSQQSNEWVKTQLWEALVDGLIVPVAEKYKFVHDRVQQAAYLLVPEIERAATHLQIGRLWLANTVAIESSAALLEIVNQLNAGNQLITEEAEKLRLAELNLKAGQRAKNSAAYETALNYFTSGIGLFAENGWQVAYPLAFDLYIEQAECNYLVGHFEAAEQGFDLILSQAKTALERAALLGKKVVLYNHRQLFRESLVCGKEGLALLGSPVPHESAGIKMAIAQEMAAIQASLANLEIEALIDLPELTEPTKLKVMELCMSILPTSYMLSDMDLSTWLILKTVNLSLHFGNSRWSSLVYTSYGFTLAIGLREYNTAYRFAKLGQALGQKYPDISIWCRTNHVFALFISHLKYPLIASLDHFQAGYLKGLEAGNLEYAGFSMGGCLIHEIYTGKNLEIVHQNIKKYLLLLEKINNRFVIENYWANVQYVLSLLGRTGDKYSLGDEEAVKIATSKKNHSIIFYLLSKLMLHYIYGDYATALKFAREGEPLMVRLAGAFLQVEFCFYYALTLATLYATLENEEKEKLASYQARLKLWAKQCPENFQHMDLLVSAQMSRNAGEAMAALKCYKQAIQSARDNGFTHKEALANELLANFWLEQGEEEYAKVHLREAYSAYVRWGAQAKVKDLEKHYPHWLPPHRTAATSVIPTLITTTLPMTSVSVTRLATSTDWLDLTSVLKAAQTLSDEMVLENLLEKMMHTVIENAGAQRGVLILEDQGQWLIQAELTVQPETVTVLQASPLDGRVPTTLLNYVIRTKQSAVFADLQQEAKYQTDDYVRTQALKSVLCLTLLHQQKLVGVIYLENNLTTGAFTPDRFQVLTLLSSQMAISLDNARFVRELEQARQVAEDARQAEAQARQAAEAANQAKTAFLANVSHELRTPLNGILGYTQILQHDSQLQAKQQEAVSIIHRSGEHLLVLVSDILDISKLQTGRLELQPTEVHFSQLLTELANWFRDQAQEKGLFFRYEPVSHLPMGIVADGKRLRQILLHLLSNAVKFTQHGSITFQVQNTPLPNTAGWQHFQFIVTDTGIGMTESNLSRLFTPFEQASDWLHKSAGAGLGLSLAKQLIELMGGQIQVRSSLGQGSTFTVLVDFAESKEWQSVNTSERLLERSDIPPLCVTDIPTESDQPLIGPSAEKAAELCELANIGDFMEIIDLVEKLAQENQELIPFTTKVRQWAKNFQDEPIEKLARQFMETTD